MYSFTLSFNLALDGDGGQYDANAALPPKNRYGTHFTGGCMSRGENVGKCGNSCFHRDSIPGLSIP
jgi:hypothetical protein